MGLHYRRHGQKKVYHGEEIGKGVGQMYPGGPDVG